MRLTKPQSKIYQDDTRFRVIVAGRRFGKTFLSTVELITKAIEGQDTAQANPRLKALNQYVLDLYLRQVMATSVAKQTLPQVKSQLKAHLHQWERWAKKYHKDIAAHYLDLLAQYEQSPEDFARTETPDLPDGSPIGSDMCLFPDLE